MIQLLISLSFCCVVYLSSRKSSTTPSTLNVISPISRSLSMVHIHLLLVELLSVLIKIIGILVVWNTQISVSIGIVPS